MYFNSKNSIYYTFDDSRFLSAKYLDELIKYAINLKKEYIYIDEIQNINNWGGIVKKFYDVKNIKLILSGSSGIKISKGKESLSGRLNEIEILPLSLNEHIYMSKNKDITDYITKGLPEITTNKLDDKKYIKSIISKIINEDIPLRYNIDKPEILNDLIQILSERNSNLLNYRGISNALNLNKDTVKKYIHFLEKSYILNIISVYSKKVSTSNRKNKKIYFKFPSIANAYHNNGIGASIENLVYLYLSKKYNTYFIREKDKEIDFIADNIPIEVKYQNLITKSDYSYLNKYMEKNKINIGYVITKNTYENIKIDNREIKLVPLEYLLLNKTQL